MSYHDSKALRPPCRWPVCAGLLAMFLSACSANAQRMFEFHGDPIPLEVESTYQHGLDFLVKSQQSNGSFIGQSGAEAGVVGAAVLAMLAHGDDPNFGPYASAIKRGLSYLISLSNAANGYMGTSMYNHGFATLALAEAYGAVDDPRLGPALQKAVDLILASQANNPMGAWRYAPTSKDADTTVSGAQMVALFAARNAGIDVPDAAIEKGLHFFESTMSAEGGFGYTSPAASSPPRSAIGTLVFALAKRKDSKAFQAAYRNLRELNAQASQHLFYYLYYASQAYFHADMNAWREWNAINIKRLASIQNENGSWPGSNGPVFSTSTALLSLAVNYRFLPIYER
ncbi:MAG: terpene cyclase/mutase family protein [Verrucomicrobia bacterium]|nr:terpene cyclase/mutase family protein [Verrucomicrobiota bacterium]